ncbi:hypothetical protein AVEN_268247-1, partial [Araneus ventricosus]
MMGTTPELTNPSPNFRTTPVPFRLFNALKALWESRWVVCTTSEGGCGPTAET